jgi:hypothetical protein
MKFAKELHQLQLECKLQNLTTRHNLSCEGINKRNADEKAETHLGRNEQMTEQKEKKESFCSRLTQFVRTHVYLMLKKLYTDIKCEEEGLKLMTSVISADDFPVREWLEDITAGKWPGIKARTPDGPSEAAKPIELVKAWYTVLYYNKASSDIRIVGPVGERPVHVCALSAFRFGEVDFQGAGNYLSEGIVQGMMDYIALDRAPDAARSGGRIEATARYGKDYCAAVGSLLLHDEAHAWGRGRLPGAGDEEDFPPFWRQICAWKRAHMRSRCGLAPQCCWLKTPERFATMLVSTGIYEGETILFPLIAGRAEDAIHRLLDKKHLGLRRCALLARARACV